MLFFKRLNLSLGLCLCFFMSTAVVSTASASEVDPFLEAFALGDREAALKKLIPGTEDFYYYHCLYAQQQADQPRYQQVLADWRKNIRHSSTKRKAIELRQTLLTYNAHPQQTVDFLKNLLGIHLNHQRTGATHDRSLPSTLNQNQISWKAFESYVNSQYRDSLQGYEDHTLEQISSRGLSMIQLRQYLKRLQQPEVPGLVAAIVRELNDRRSAGFGSLAIHNKLLLTQLQAVAKAAPKALNSEKYVRAYLQRLQPRDGSAWREDVQQRQAYLESMWAFVSRLSAAHNSLKAHVLYHRLMHDRQQGIWDQQRFLTYMSLPRQSVYMNRAYLKRHNHHHVNLRADYQQQTSFPSIGSDQALVRSYLEAFFTSAKDYRVFSKYFEESYLKRVFAEQKVLLGEGDMEQWASWLGASQFRTIQERIELGFSEQNQTVFPIGEKVSLKLRIKNIKQLMLRVYPINTLAWYADNKRQVQTDFDVDGLVTELETTYDYTQLPALRHSEDIALVDLNKRGVYIVEFLGNGYRCRSMITIGNLDVRERIGTAGHVLSIFDDNHNKVKGAIAQFGNHRFEADANGSILIPFATHAGQKQVIIEHDGFATLYDLQHHAEEYQLNIDAHVDQQEALAGATARVMIRPQLFLHGQPVSLGDLEKITVTIDATTIDNVHSTTVIDDVKLNELDAWTHDIRMPERVRSMNIRVHAEIERFSTGEKQKLSADSVVSFNGLMTTQQFKDAYLRPTQSGYILDVLGRNGEAYANESIQRIEIKHRDFKSWKNFVFRTDKNGSVHLGALKDMSDIRVIWSGHKRKWHLAEDRQLHSDELHLRSNEDVTLAWAYTAADVQKTHLLSQQGNAWHGTYSKHLSLTQEGRLQIKGLPAGKYQLLLPYHDGKLTIIVEDGERHNDGIFGKHRILSDTVPHGLSVSPMKEHQGNYRFKVYGYSAATRIHVVATRFMADQPLIESLGSIARRNQSEFYPFRTPAEFLGMQRLSDEHRYILDRAYQNVYPSLMLQRPALLLHPWERKDTNTGHIHGAGGGAFGAHGSRSGGGKKRAHGRSGGTKSSQSMAMTPTYDFLEYAAVVLSNLAIDADGYVSIPKELFADQQFMQILAVEPEQAFQRNATLSVHKLQRREQRLMQNLGDTQQRQTRSVAVVSKGATQNVSSDPASWRVLSTFAEAFELLDTLCDDSRFNDFTFLKQWPSLSLLEKEKQYSDFACHELHVFLYMKDRAFFDTHVATTLNNKHDKTFVDHYLLDHDLSAYLRPWAFARLNAFERALFARRLGKGKDGAGILRSLQETVEMQNPNSQHEEFLFYTALRGKALQAPAMSFMAIGAGREGRRQSAEKSNARRNFNRINEKKEMRDADEGLSADMLMEETEFDDAPAPASMAPQVAVGNDKKGKGYFAKDRKAAMKNKARRLFRQLDSTKEWAENNYYKRIPDEQLSALVSTNAFWLAYAQHPTDDSFIHKNLTDCAANASAALLALAVSDLPFVAEKHSYKKADAGFSITVGSDSLVYYMSFADMKKDPEAAMPLVSIQNLYRMNDRYLHEKGQRIEKFVRGPLLYRDVYGAQIVLTNPTARPHQVDLLAQIPQGAIPLQSYKATLGKGVSLNAYSIERVEVLFYFPEAGSFSWYAASLNKAGALLAQADTRSLKVVTELPDSDRESWQYIADFGTDAQVLSYLKAHNIKRLDLARIAFRMHAPAMYRSVIDLLDGAQVYEAVLWSYGFKHMAVNEMRQWLEHNQHVTRQCGMYFDSLLFSSDAVERLRYEHLEYYPLINARTHALGGKRQIANSALANQYRSFLQAIIYVPTLRDSDKFAAVVYYISQERIEEAISLFANIQRLGDNGDGGDGGDSGDMHQTMQYDYCKAYLALCQEDVATAQTICTQYAASPIQRWQEKFAVMSAQLAEITDDNARVINDENRDQEMAQRALNEAMIDIEAHGNQVRISYRNLKNCTMNFYRMDLELLFSRNPFMRGEGGQFAYISPNLTKQTTLPTGKSVIDIDLPQTLQQGNVLVEVVAGGLRRRVVLFVHQLQVLTQDNFGQLQVRHKVTGKVKSKVYVKVYARMNSGVIKFYKDGYTDLRGRFDYASISTNDLDNVERFSILIVDKTNGALVREVAPPQR